MANLVRRDTRDAYPFNLMDALLRWDPRSSEPGRAPHAGAGFAPAFDVKETKDAYVIKADLPGVKDEDLAISMTGNQLTVAGKRDEQWEEGARYHALERGRGSFARTFVLPDGVDGDHVTAVLKDGVLSLHIPKRPEAQPRKIPIGKGASGAKAAA
jgi:HSP20 family protein